jgi:glucose/arabinose dehydrogenase
VRRFLLLAASAVLLLGLGSGGAALCRYTGLNCHLHHQSGRPQPEQTAAPTGPTRLPPGFLQDVIARGLQLPTAFAFLPDGRILIAEKSGRLRVIKSGRLLPAPLLDIRKRVNTDGDRGLLEVTPDPHFARNHYIYLLYVYEDDPFRPREPKTVRVSRFTVSGDSASPGSEKVVLGTAAARSCKKHPRGADCLPADFHSHTGGTIAFAPGGAMFVSTGEGASARHADDLALGSQSRDWLGGKLLRVTASGRGLPGNPFWDGNPRSNRSKVWAYGFRNPFRFTFRPHSARPYIGDPGWMTTEEIDVGHRGQNYGWPCYEGTQRQPAYAAKSICRALYRRGSKAVEAPLVTYPTAPAGAVVGGAFYTGGAYPSKYRGAYFYGDFVKGWIRYIQVDARNRLVAGPRTFATRADGPVDIEIGPGNDLYYLAIDAGELRRVRFIRSQVLGVQSRGSNVHSSS